MQNNSIYAERKIVLLTHIHSIMKEQKLLYIFFFLFVILKGNNLKAQSGIEYDGHDVFLNGGNIAWVRFSGDIGSGYTDLNRFREMFQEVHASGGNNMRFWMHTTGSNSPQFDNSGKVIGPGAGTIEDLKNILDIAWENEVTLMLCLWSFDMLRISNGTIITDRSKPLLNDVNYLDSYLQNALTPMVEAVKGHPAIMTWEVFNEPEGMSNEFGWDFNYHVPMINIQRFINKVAGTIHRIDANAKVTNGAWSFMAMTDVPTKGLYKQQLEELNSLSIKQKAIAADAFKQKYEVNLSFSDILNHYSGIINSTAANINYYSDARLFAAGGDMDGYLDFYTVHYYDWAGTSLSPFHKPFTYWALDKPLAVAEFFMYDTDGIKYSELYQTLFNSGYAGALAWQYYDGEPHKTRMNIAMSFMYDNYRKYVTLIFKPGQIFSFSADSRHLEFGQSTMLKWETSEGSTVFLNSQPVNPTGTITINPTTTTEYTLTTTGSVSESKKIVITVLEPGTILSFEAQPTVIAKGESSLLKWTTSKGSSVTLNGYPVNENDSLTVFAEFTTLYKLLATGSKKDSAFVNITVLDPGIVNRALNRPITVSSINEESGDLAEYAVDGNPFTKWTSESSPSQWLEIDLSADYILNKIIVYWGDAYAKSFRIGISENKTIYSVVYNTLLGNGETVILDNLNNKARYVKLIFDKLGLGPGYSINEIEVYGTKDASTGLPDLISDNPQKFSLSQNFPNPFNPITTIEYMIPNTDFGIKNSVTVSLIVYDLLGREVKTLVNNNQLPGIYNVEFDGSKLSSGIYLYRITAGIFSMTKRMILIK
ncbi:MAG: discoidin domain-containing protein [Bacteroidetes bacterium]|nr:discoidin domain-containing protein [Bacteroidota bacterium]